MKRIAHILRHCERSEAIQGLSAEAVWIASSHQRKIATQFCRELLAMTVEERPPYDSRISSSRRPSPFSSFFTALDATTSPSLA